jgi:D-apionolactonase
VREPSRFEIWYGRDAPPPELRELRAGPVSAVLDGIDLRYVRVGDVEVVRRLFVAVRDAAWGTAPPFVSDLEVEDRDHGFRIEFEAFHESGDLRFRWRGTISGDPDGTLEARLDGKAESDFRYNRIGFCILHPSDHAGRHYRTRTPDGEQSGTLPELIGKQRLEDGKLYPLFPSYDRIEVDVADDLRVRFDFEGDLFEMEDQRNWTDASFKTYSTPITLGWPWDAQAGQSIVQKVRLTATGNTSRPRRTEAPVQIVIGGGTGRSLPPFGLGLASHGHGLSDREVELLRRLRPDHIRVDLDLAADWHDRLELAATETRALEAGLEVVLHLADDPAAELAALPDALGRAQVRVDRVLVLRRGETVTDTRWVRLTRDVLAPAAPGASFAGGTDLWFTELNREPPERGGLDAVAYSLAATVHAADDISLRETPSAQGTTVRSAIALYGGLPVVVSPVTIRPRSWPFGDAADPRGLPFQVDQRQGSLLGAGWTTASLKHLLEAGPASVTYFETTGWCGVVEAEDGSPVPDRFPSRPGQAFPLYHILADLGEWRRGGAVVETRSSEPFAVEAFATVAGGGTHVLVANLTPTAQHCALGPLATSEAAVRSLDEETARQAGDDPAAFRSSRERRPVADGALALELPPYAVVRVDA